MTARLDYEAPVSLTVDDANTTLAQRTRATNEEAVR